MKQIVSDSLIGDCCIATVATRPHHGSAVSLHGMQESISISEITVISNSKFGRLSIGDGCEVAYAILKRIIFLVSGQLSVKIPTLRAWQIVLC
jgi:hypothetical protein